WFQTDEPSESKSPTLNVPHQRGKRCNELRKLLTTYYPDCANADIIRKPGELITIAKRNGSKGAR
ncbi:MAG: hypothetical protein ACLGGO_12230, partial [Coleofasciculus sp.]